MENGQSPAWRLNVSGPQAYERFIVPAWMDAFARDLAAAARVRPGERVLDVACGTGVAARAAARLAGPQGRVVGTDADGEMLRWAATFARGEGLEALEWKAGQASALPSDDGRFDVVLCQHGLQFFPDRPAALREMRRVLAPGGRAAVSVWRALDRLPLFTVLGGVLDEVFGREATAVLQASCSLPDREALRALLAGAGFRDVRVRLESRVARHPSIDIFLPGYLSVFPLGARIDRLPEDERADLFRRLAAGLADFTDDDGLAVPMECHVATARA